MFKNFKDPEDIFFQMSKPEWVKEVKTLLWDGETKNPLNVLQKYLFNILYFNPFIPIFTLKGNTL